MGVCVCGVYVFWVGGAFCQLCLGEDAERRHKAHRLRGGKFLHLDFLFWPLWAATSSLLGPGSRVLSRPKVRLMEGEGGSRVEGLCCLMLFT
jgi:hypothetical protein